MDKCRVCLDGENFSSIFIMRDSIMISTKLMSLARVKIYPNDGLPSKICSHCIKKLDNCIAFIKQCENSDLKLRSLTDDSYDNLADSDEQINLEIENYPLKLEDVHDTEIEPITKHNSTDSQANQLFLNNTCDVQNEDIDGKCSDKEKKLRKQQCFTCGKVMSSKFRLKTHLRTHTGERPFSCSLCDKKFSLAQNLKVHLRVHTGEKPLSCSDCGATFAQTAGLAVHRRKHTGQTPYRCILCPRSFRTVGHLQYHIRRHTGEKNFECETCGRSFITRSDLKQHLRTHTGDKPHVCSFCGLGLTRASHLKRHIQYIHNGNKPFHCPECPSNFLHKAEFDKHKRKHIESKHSDDKS